MKASNLRCFLCCVQRLHSHTQRAKLACIAVTKNTQIHEWIRGYIRGGGRKLYAWWR